MFAEVSLFTQRQLEKVSPSWMAPKDAGKVKTSEVLVRSRRVFGCPDSGELPCNERIEAVECACWALVVIFISWNASLTENDGELE